MRHTKSASSIAGNFARHSFRVHSRIPPAGAQVICCIYGQTPFPYLDKHTTPMAFRARWRELTKEGWTSKKPSGLSDEHTYLKPGKTKKDVEDEDFFVGPEALMRYLDRCDRGKSYCVRLTPMQKISRYVCV